MVPYSYISLNTSKAVALAIYPHKCREREAQYLVGGMLCKVKDLESGFMRMSTTKYQIKHLASSLCRLYAVLENESLSEFSAKPKTICFD